MSSALVTRRTRAKETARRWRNMPASYHPNRRIVAAMSKLGEDPDPADVDRILGHRRQTMVRCDGCGDEADQGVDLTSHSDDEYGPCTYCRECLLDALALLEDGGDHG